MADNNNNIATQHQVSTDDETVYPNQEHDRLMREARQRAATLAASCNDTRSEQTNSSSNTGPSPSAYMHRPTSFPQVLN